MHWALKWCMIGLFSTSVAQKGLPAGKIKQNVLLPMPMKVDGTQLATSVTLDSNWRWWHNKDGYDNCFAGDWVQKYCPDPLKCAENCVVEGVPAEDWKRPYGASVAGNALTLNYVTQGEYGQNVGSRVYLMDPNGKDYQGFDLRNREFSFTVDVSKLPCGLNGALYFVEMPLNTGRADISSAYGVNYGDAQCPKDIKYIGGWANTNSSGACSNEMDIWEANSMATAFTPHTCSNIGVKACTKADECGDGGSRYKGWCDKDGADYNPYRHGDKTLYGPGPNFRVDTTKAFQVITQFITHNNKDDGDLVRIKRLYSQNGKLIEGGELSDDIIAGYKAKFKETNHFAQLGGMKGMGQSFARKMVLVLSIWDDSSPARMKWLDATYPVGSAEPGAVRGPCPVDSGDPSVLRRQVPDSHVIYSDIQVNRLPTPSPTPSPTLSPAPSPAPSPTPSPTPSTPAAGFWKCTQCVPM